MLEIGIIILGVLGMLALERVCVVSACRSEKGRERIRSWPVLHPNSISLMRLPMGIASVMFWHHGLIHQNPLHLKLALFWFAFWMISDLSDGTIARHCDLSSRTGEWLDPLSDKAMYFPVLIYFAFYAELYKILKLPAVLEGDSFDPSYLPRTGILLFLAFDIAGQASRLFSEKQAANTFGKAKTALVTILIATLALHQICIVENIDLSPLGRQFPQHLAKFYGWTTVSMATLAFFSLYAKLIPDHWYANSFTAANFLCGLGGLLQVGLAVFGHPGPVQFRNYLMRAFLLVFLGQIFDLFDGRLARKYGSTKHGPLFDDIADGTSFGGAIGAIIFACLYLGEGSPLRGQPAWAAAIALFYLGCVIFRLYRFLNPDKPGEPGIFVGMPSPAGAMLAGAGVMLFPSDLFEFRLAGILGLFLVLLSSLLMVCKVRYLHFGQKIMPGLSTGVRLVVGLLALLFAEWSLIYTSKHVEDQPPYPSAFLLFCLALVSAYAVLGLASWRTLSRKLRPAGQPTPPEPPHPQDP